MQKLCCVRTRQHPLPVWSHKFVISSLTHFSTNSHPFSVGIVSLPLEEVVIWVANSSQTRWAFILSRCFLTMVLPMSLSRHLLKTLYKKSFFNLTSSRLSASPLGLKVGWKISSQSWALAVTNTDLLKDS